MKEYKIDIDESFLKVLGPQMYTNIYYVLGEVIANAYDADAENVYLTINSEKKIITIEDDGIGMNYSDINNKFLRVAVESRTSSSDSKTLKGRFKLGRKGIGKLAVLSISNNVEISSIKNTELNGFILSTKLENNKVLKSIPEKEITFNKINLHGTKILMKDILIEIPKQLKTIKNNLLKILPIFSKEFTLHLNFDGNEEIVNSFDFQFLNNFATLINIEDDILTNKIENLDLKFLKSESSIKKKLLLRDKNNKEVEKELIIKGWIGTRKTTKNFKKELTDFSDNHISIYSNGKLGMFNLLPRIGKNRLYESYVVGMFNINILEDSDLIDIALSNREGYQTNDKRFIESEKIIRDLLDKTINYHLEYKNSENSEKELEKINKLREEESKLNELYSSYLEEASSKIAEKVNLKDNENLKEEIKESISFEMNKFLSLKSNIILDKRKILISHSSRDKEVTNFIYEFLKYNNVNPEEFIYSSAIDDEAKLPLGINIFDYLRDFFVKSITNSNMIVIYIVSENLESSWNACTEVGAGWITKTEDKVFSINNNNPKNPLNISNLWMNINYKDDFIEMSLSDINEFSRHIEELLNSIKFNYNSRQKNIEWIKKRDDVKIIE